MTVQDLYETIDRLAPFATQYDEDNSGLLVGSASQEVTGILFALDVSQRVIDEAVSLGVQLIVTHHPLMFSPIRALTDSDHEGRLIRRLTQENISLIAAHTNLDQAPGGNQRYACGTLRPFRYCRRSFFPLRIAPRPPYRREICGRTDGSPSYSRARYGT